METHKDRLIKAAVLRFQAQKAEAQANLMVYLNSSVGVSEHPNVVEEIAELTKKIAEADECISVLDRDGR